MGDTAYEEQLGGSIVETIGADYMLRLPTGPGGCRLYVLSTTVGGLKIKLPDARMCPTGAPCYTIINNGANDFTLRDTSDTLLATIGAGHAEKFACIDRSTSAGQWIGIPQGAVTVGTTLNANRIPVDVVISHTTANGISVASLIDEMGIDRGASPLAVRVWIKPNVIIGNETTTPALSTGEYLAGTTMRIYLDQGARIIGKGGDGGRGAHAIIGSNASAPTPGGTALRIYLDTVLLNFGYIQGGGGGGGGGGWTNPPLMPGGGGGGGAGYPGGRGGRPGNYSNGTLPNNGHGGDGSVQYAGQGGIVFQSGNTGGQGSAGGAPGTAAGAAAGNAIEKMNGAVLTKLVTGIIDGAEVSL